MATAKHRVSAELVAAILATLLLVFLLAAFYYLNPSPALAFGLGLVAALATGLLVPLIVFALQAPRFVVWPAGDSWDGKSPYKFIHVVVRNTTYSFMGGGVAGGLRGEIRVDGQTKVYTPKWVAKTEPIDIQFLPPLPGAPASSAGYASIVRLDPGLMEESKIQTINPQEEHVLDIAVKVDADPLCYIHEPENYGATAHKRNPFGPGEHRISLTLRSGAAVDGPFEFVLVNGAGTSPDSLTLRRAKEDDLRTQPPTP